MYTVAAFDLGIKNLSYCVATFDISGSLQEIKAWANLNLLADGAASQSQTRCTNEVAGRTCGGPASFQDVPVQKLLCKKCAKKSAKPILDISGSTLPVWRAWTADRLTQLGFTAAEAKKASKAALMEKAGAIRLMPYKAPKAKGVSLQQILIGMEACLNTELPRLAVADVIRIENQPSEFAPHMKSIQIMLFTLIDHRLRKEHGWTGSIEFVNAGVKTRGTDAGVGKDAKRSRKLAGITKVTEVLSLVASAAEKLAWWKAQAKQDDLADAFLMCLDYKGQGQGQSPAITQ
jgi:hypothetical protein